MTARDGMTPVARKIVGNWLDKCPEDSPPWDELQDLLEDYDSQEQRLIEQVHHGDTWRESWRRWQRACLAACRRLRYWRQRCGAAEDRLSAYANLQAAKSLSFTPAGPELERMARVDIRNANAAHQRAKGRR